MHLQKGTYFNELLAPGITSIHLNRGQPRELRAHMRAGRLPYARRAGDQNSAEDIHPILARLLEAGSPVCWPMIVFSSVGMERKNETGYTSWSASSAASRPGLCSRRFP